MNKKDNIMQILDQFKNSLVIDGAYDEKSYIESMAIEHIRECLIKNRELIKNYGVNFEHGEYYTSIDKLILNQILIMHNSCFNLDCSTRHEIIWFTKKLRQVINYIFNEIKR